MQRVLHRLSIVYIFLISIATTVSAAPLVWSKYTVPAPPYYNGYHRLNYDALNHLVIAFINGDMSGGSYAIYSDSLWTYQAGTHTLTLINSNHQPGTGVRDTNGNLVGNGCVQSTPTWPGTRHPVGQVWEDNVRHRLLVIDGVCGTRPTNDMFYFQEQNPQTNKVWTQMHPAHLPNPVPLYGRNSSAVIHDTDDDVYVMWGYDEGSNTHDTWVYCPTDLNATPGVLTVKQVAAGCNADDWTEVVTTGGTPKGANFPGLVYDSVNKKVIQFGGSDTSGIIAQNQTWAYDVPTKGWQNMNPSNPPPAPSNNLSQSMPAMDFNTSSGLVYYHYASGGYGSSGVASDFTYSYAANKWTTLGDLGGPTFTQSMVYDASQDALVAWNYSGQGVLEIWTAQLSDSAAHPANPPVITTTSPLTAGVEGQAYSASFSAAGKPPISWILASGNLPGGLSLSNNGRLSGTPTAAGTFQFSMYATNSSGTSTPQNFTIVIAENEAGSTGSGSGSGTGTSPINVPLTVQEALYPGSVPGVNRMNEPFCQGVPIADSVGLTTTSTLGLIGATAGQFRILGKWPSGHAKWIEVCGIVPQVNAGGTTTLTLTNGSGNFGGSNLAVDNGSTISVFTGSATFTIKKANFNVVDQAVVNGTTVVASGTSQGLVITGPTPTAAYPRNVTCGGAGQCTTVYSSVNDANSTCMIEKNGPVEAVLKCTGDHVDVSGHVYMHFTVREYFYRGKSNVKVTSILRNADYGTSNTFATAYKGHQGYELRITPNISGTLNYTVANDTAIPTTGTMAGSDSVYLYQGESQHMKWQDWCGDGCVPFTKDKGYLIVKNGHTILGGSDTQYVQGWADISDRNGVGVQIGVYQMSAYWPKSLEFNNGGTDVRIGIWPRENSQPYYQEWPQQSTHDLYLNFHSAAPVSPANEFLKFQHYLLARAPFTYYNTTGVFPYTLIDPKVEDQYYSTAGSTATPAISSSWACCIQDFGTSNSQWPLSIFRFYYWHSGGGGNQTEFRWSYLLNFLTRSMTGRYLEAAHFYHFMADSAWPRSDGFNWRDKPHINAAGSTAQVDGLGFPMAASANSGLATGHANWLDQEHGHWYGMTDYYFLSGDETIKDAILNGPKDRALNPDTYLNGQFGGLWNSRAVGVELMSTARLSKFLASIGDASAPDVLQQGADDYAAQVSNQLCVSGFPSGCTFGPIQPSGSWLTQGISRTRGLHYGGTYSYLDPWCGNDNAQVRGAATFMANNLIQGILELRDVEGSGWSEYLNSLDLAYGVSRWALSEMYVDDHSGRWDVNGFRYYIALDLPGSCNGTQDYHTLPQAQQTVSFTFLPKYLVDGDTNWADKFKINIQRDEAAIGVITSDFGSYEVAHMMGIINNPLRPALSNLAIKTFTDNGGGSYTIAWTVPPGTQSYRIKWGPRTIVDWIGFDPIHNVFTGDPVNTMAWFAATNVPSLPVPAAAAATQSLTINTGVSNLRVGNFSVKAYVGSTGVPPTGSASIIPVRGNGQTGGIGKPLVSPLTVQVLDGNGSPISAATVTFMSTSGGGFVTAFHVTTNSQGEASTSLTLGSKPGSDTVVASSAAAPGASVVFIETATDTGSVTPAELIYVSGNDQNVHVNQTFAAPLTVEIVDTNGNAVAGSTVNFAVTSGNATVASAVVSTNAQGLARAILTPGKNTGSLTVAATAANLTGSPVVFTENITRPTTTFNVTWTKQTLATSKPGHTGYSTLLFDPVSEQTIVYSDLTNSHSIYATDLFFYNAAANAWTHVSGTGDLTSVCPQDTPSVPGDRHPVGNMSIDTNRNYLWMWGGSCGSPRQDMYHLKLNTDPSQDEWTQVSSAHLPPSVVSASVYDPDDDLIFVFGYDGGDGTRNNWLYCPATDPQAPSVLTAAQIAAGCSAADDWTSITPVGMVEPNAKALPGMVYDPNIHKIILYGGLNSGLTFGFNETWTYDVPSRTWTRVGLSSPAPPALFGWTGDGMTQIAYDSQTGNTLYHQCFDSGAPADWQYDPSADTWTKLTSTGGVSGTMQALTYDPMNNILIGFDLDPETQSSAVWQGTLLLESVH